VEIDKALAQWIGEADTIPTPVADEKGSKRSSTPRAMNNSGSPSPRKSKDRFNSSVRQRLSRKQW
jgi:hypothetical protein